MNNMCVAWSRETNRLSMLSQDDLANLNLSAFLDDKPGLVVIRTWCTEEDARRFVRAYAALVAKRGMARITAESATS